MNRSLFALALMPLAPSAQASRDAAPLKYWPAPLYWQPTQSETRAAARPELFNTAGNNQPAQTPANSLVFVAITPCRLVDTRTGFGFTGAFGPPSLAGGGTRNFPIQNSTTCSVPAIAQAYSLNLTVVPPGPLTYLTIWPGGSSQPNASALNDTLGGIVANATIVPAGADASGSVNVFVSNNTDLIIDINGYYAAQSGITLSQGSVGAPSLSFSGDSGTGVFSSGPGSVSIATSGTNRLTVRSDGDVDLPGSLRKNGLLFLHNLGTSNTAVGLTALSSNTTGSSDTAAGYQALASNTTASQNTAFGYRALFANTTAIQNTAVGWSALSVNTTGASNTATGSNALQNNTTGFENTAIGLGALANNTTGLDNTAAGVSALPSNTTGIDNVAIGVDALFTNTAGNSNIAIGTNAGGSVQGGINSSNNIHIGSAGSSGDSGVIRIGSGGNQTTFFAAGVRGVTTGAANAVAVLIDSNGQLGTANSSIRFKEDVQDMAGASSGLLQLRPVTYRYKQPYADGSKPLDYGLIAEEVAQVYPDLVAKGADGQVETVQYQKLTPMLLNEVQKLESRLAEAESRLVGAEARLAETEARLAAVTPTK